MPEQTVRLLHVINDLRVGGAERLLADLLPHLREAGYDVSLVALGVSDSYLQRQLAEGTEAGSPIALELPGPDLAIRSPKQILRLRKLLRGVDIVHVQLFPAQLWVALAAATLPSAERPRLITTEHNTTNGRRGNPILRLLDRWMYGQYERIVAISQAAQAALEAWVPGVGSKVTVILNAVDIGRITDAAPANRRALFGVGEDSWVVACTGRFEPQKDQATLIRALALLPEGVHVAFLGDGPMRADAERLAVSLDVEGRTHFLGIRDDVPGILKACDTYAQPSLWEGFGIAVVEAMAAGLPVVISDVPGMSEVVGEAGLTFPPGEPGALAAAITRLFTEPEEGARCAAAGLDRAELFRIESAAAAHVALYESLI